MSNLTIVVDEDVLRRARQRALQQGTSVNALLRDYLTSFAGGGAQRTKAIQRILRMAAKADTGSEGRRWSREELHER